MPLKSIRVSHGEASKIDDQGEEDGWSSDGTAPSYDVARNERCLKFDYLGQLIEDGNKKCDGAGSTKTEVPSNENTKHDLQTVIGVLNSRLNSLEFCPNTIRIDMGMCLKHLAFHLPRHL